MNDKLTAKQQRFVKSYAQGKAASEAVVEAGYNVSTKASAHSLGTDLTHNAKIQRALAKALEEEFPDAEKQALSVLRDIITDPGLRSSERVKAIETLAKIFGWNAPTKSASINVSKKLALPED